MAATPQASIICGPRGESLYPSPQDRPGKYRHTNSLQRDIKRSISEYDHAEKVTLCAQIAARIPALSGAIRQKNEWAFPPDSWQPIFYHDYSDNDTWSDAAEEWLVHTVFQQALIGNSRKDLIRSIAVSGMDADRHGRDLAIFRCDASTGFMPRMQVVPGPRIGNGKGGDGGWWSSQTVSQVGFGSSGSHGSGYSICKGGEFDGYRIYQGIIHNSNDEPIAARILGMKLEGGNWIETYSDVRLGFQYGTHLWSEYDWHGMGSPLPKMSAAILKWLRKEEIDDLLLTGLANAASQTVIHQLAEGEDAPTALGDGLDMVETMDANGNTQTVYVAPIGDGGTKYIGSNEDLKGLSYENPHPNVQEFSRGNLVECLHDYGWPYSFLDSGDGGRAATRLDCELANNSIWQKQSPGEERLCAFVKFAIACGITHKHLAPAPLGPLDAPYKWTFGSPKEISVDAGNDVTAYLQMLRFGLTSQRIGTSRWGYVLKRIAKDRRKEAMMLADNTKAYIEYVKKEGMDITSPEYLSASQFFYQPSPNPFMPQAAKPETDDSTTAPTEKKKTVKPTRDAQGKITSIEVIEQ
jgi:hypothetical protein